MLAALLLAAALQLLPISWTCPMHPEIVEDAKGTCPICRMPLEPIRLDTVWSCPIHSVIAAAGPGRCPVCGRELARATMAVIWTCADHPNTSWLEPARCTDGTQAVAKYSLRPHGNHNPQHGGQFFMAPDNWHHLEGAYPRDGVFRVYLYNDYSKPLTRDQVQRVTGRVTLGSSEFPLAVAGGGRYLETRIPSGTLPLELTARLRFQPDGPEHRFDFTYTAYSLDSPSRSAPAEAAAAEVNPAPAPPEGASIEELASALHARADQIQAAITRRAYTEIWMPALQAKDIALTIDASATGSGPYKFAVVTAVSELVRAAWLLDAVGDQGNADEIGKAHARFTAALARLDGVIRR